MVQSVFKLVYNRKNKLGNDGKALVQLYVYREYNKKYFSTGIHLTPDEWNPKNNGQNYVNKTQYNVAYFAVINNYFVQLMAKLRAKEAEYFIKGEHISDTEIYQLIRGKEKNALSFVDFMEKTIEERSDISNSTKLTAKSVVNKLKEYGIINFSDLTVENLEKMQNKLLKHVGLSRAHKIHAIIKVYINIAIRRDIFPFEKNPYHKLTVPRGKSDDRKYLTPEELALIEKKEFHIERLRKVKDLFLFSCYTGLAYIDVQSLTKDNIVKEGDVQFIKTFREKTSQKSIIYLFDKAKEILKKYEGSTFLLPRMTNQRLNSYLKEIADLSEVNKNLTFHMARHTFATTILLSNNVPIEVVSRALGHTDIKTTQLYAKIRDKMVAESMSGVEQKLKNLSNTKDENTAE